jgi:hypothetical protein
MKVLRAIGEIPSNLSTSHNEGALGPSQIRGKDRGNGRVSGVGGIVSYAEQLVPRRKVSIRTTGLLTVLW